MASPTRTEVEAQWVNAATILDEIEAFGSRNATNLLDLIDTLTQSYEGDYTSEAAAAVEAIRSAIAGTVSTSTARTVQRPFLRTYLESVVARKNVNQATDEELLSELYDYFIDNSLRVQGRVASFGSATSVAGNGDAQIFRLTKDKDNFDIEAFWADKKRIRCITDHNTGSDRGNESWLIEGQGPLKDELKRSGSGLQGILTGQTVDDSLLSNAGFQSFDSATSPTDITDWDSSATINATNYGFDSTNTFRKGPSDGATTYSLRVKATTILSQKLSDIGQSLVRDVPYMLAVIWNRVPYAASGDLVLRMGNTSSGTISIAAQTGWNVSVCPPSTGWSNWYDVFKEDDLQIDIDWTRSSGDLLIAEALLVPGVLFDNHWYWAMPSNTSEYVPPLVDDEFSITDTISDSSIIQKWLWRAWDFYLPHSNGSSITWSGS